ncbi:MAG: hypothetical protein K9K84_11545, partial [Methylovulum sp.]|nr:hypothetical protein [Methylovulum sp.]
PIPAIANPPMAKPIPPVTTPIVPIIAEATQPTAPPATAPMPIDPMPIDPIPGMTKDETEPVKTEK